jgi:hypothetical protein
LFVLDGSFLQGLSYSAVLTTAKESKKESISICLLGILSSGYKPYFSGEVSFNCFKSSPHFNGSSLLISFNPFSKSERVFLYKLNASLRYYFPLVFFKSCHSLLYFFFSDSDNSETSL